jgi:hypothetical protein
LGFITMTTDGYLSLLFLSGSLLALAFSLLMVVLTPHAWFLSRRTHASCKQDLQICIYSSFSVWFFFQFSPYSVHIRMDLLESITLATGGYLSLDLFSCSYFFFVDMVEFFMVRNTHRTHATCI